VSTNDDIRLTPREEQVAALAGEGMGYAEIGRTLNISPRTAETYITRIALRIPGNAPALRKVAIWAASRRRT
jgi:DNA-binding CsgD family transcriptional regulator